MAEVLLEDLNEMFSQLRVRDVLRSSQKMPLPDANTCIAFEKIAFDMLQKNLGVSVKERNKRLITNFGGPPIVIAKTWELIIQKCEYYNDKVNFEKKHLLWLLHRLKVYGKEKTMTSTLSAPDEKTFQKWTKIMAQHMEDIVPLVIKLSNRKIDDRGCDCLMSVDTFDSPFQQCKINDDKNPGKKKINKALNSFKFKGPGLRYEVACALKTPDIVWISGPFLPGDWNDAMIFQHGLIHMLEEDERVEADKIYWCLSPKYVKCVGAAGLEAEEEDAIRRSVEARQEAINKKFKFFECLTKPYSGGNNVDPLVKIMDHKAMFYSVASFTQIAMEMGYTELWSLKEY